MASNPSGYHHQTNPGSTLFGQQKVAIPRLQRVEQENTGAKDRRRVPRACTGVSLNRAQSCAIEYAKMHTILGVQQCCYRLIGQVAFPKLVRFLTAFPPILVSCPQDQMYRRKANVQALRDHAP